MKLRGPIGAERQEAEIKYRLLAAIDQAERQGGTVEQSCAVLGLERRRYYRWKGSRSLAEMGMADWVDRPAGPPPGAGAHRLLEREKEQIRQAAQEERHADLHHRKLCHQLGREGRVTVSESSVYRVLKAEGWTGPPRAMRPKRPGLGIAVTRPNQLWSWDVSYLRVSETFMYLIAIIDDYSRKIVGHALGYEPHAEAMKRVWDGALSREGLLDPFGRPTGLTAHSDNGSVMKAKSMRRFFSDLGMAQEFTRPATPTDNARMERWFETIKYEKLYYEDLTDPLRAIRLADEFVVYYNEVRLHQGLGYVTPQEKHLGKDVQILAQRKEALKQARQNRLEWNRHSVAVDLVQAVS